MRNLQKQSLRGDILIVDDTIPNLQLLSKMLTDEGYKYVLFLVERWP
jgi:PleD family two-component response regulator